MNKKVFKQEKAITMIALVVTIVVLLILAGVSIAGLTGQNGILDQTAQVKEDVENDQIEDKVELSVIEAMKTTAKLTDEKLKKALDHNFDGYEISGDEDSGWVIKIGERSFNVDKDGNINNVSTVGDIEIMDEATDYTKPYLPDKNKFKKVDGTTLENGLVIEDKNGNQYVWIEVPKTDSVYRLTGSNETGELTDYDCAKIESDLHTYTSTYRNGTTNDDIYASDSSVAYYGVGNESDWYTEETYNEAKRKMLRSVYKYGGFWVGRYEAGTKVARKAYSSSTPIPVSKADMYPYVYITRLQAKNVADKVESGACTSSLMFGVQWDLMLVSIEKWMCSNSSAGGATGEAPAEVEAQNKLTSDSTSIGNYLNSELTLNRGKFSLKENFAKWYMYNSEEKTDFVTSTLKKSQTMYDNGVLLTTGASENTKTKNIYDVAGNAGEWTLETSANVMKWVWRGGKCLYSGTNLPASYRYTDGQFTLQNSLDSVNNQPATRMIITKNNLLMDGLEGFRVTIY